MTWTLDFATTSDRGLVRGNNEDSAYAGPHLLALADGMGGHAAGEIASQLMINHLRVLDANTGDNDMLALLGSVADDGNRAIAARVRTDPHTEGMGTTLSALLFSGRKMALCHVGDSRGYRLRDAKLQQITVDDTFVQSLVDEGKLDPEDVSTHPQRSLILKAYTGRPVEPRLELIDVRLGDRFLLCSDGLSDPVTAETIEQALRTGTPQEAATRLVDLALRSGGPDNVTVVVADVVEAPAADAAHPEAALAVTPIVAGALNSTTPEAPRPNTAAGRAAAMTARQPQEILPAGGEHNSGTPARPSRLRRALSVLTIALVSILILGALGAGSWFGWKQVQKSYYISVHEVDNQDAIVVERGARISVFGKPLHSIYQLACLDSDSHVTVINADNDAANTPATPTESCSLFTVKDLPEARRDALTTLPAGSYDTVLQQLQRLADDALPVCVVRTEAPKTEGAASESTETTSQESPTSATARPGDLSSPGVNCREVKR